MQPPAHHSSSHDPPSHAFVSHKHTFAFASCYPVRLSKTKPNEGNCNNANKSRDALGAWPDTEQVPLRPTHNTLINKHSHTHTHSSKQGDEPSIQPRVSVLWSSLQVRKRACTCTHTRERIQHLLTHAHSTQYTQNVYTQQAHKPHAHTHTHTHTHTQTHTHKNKHI
jgi:hypothetical protein